MPSRRIRCSVCGLLHNADNIRRTEDGKYICLDCIENSNGEYVECDECHIVIHNERVDEHTVIVHNEAITAIGDKHYCKPCRNHLFFQCADCHQWVLKENILMIENTLVCPDCQNNFTECPICHQVRHRANFVTVHGEVEELNMCSSCASSRYMRCNDCGEYFARARVVPRYPNGWVCNECRNNNDYMTCPDCGRVGTEDYFEWEDEDGDEFDEPICQGCYNNYGSVIHGYHEGENFIKKYTEEDSPQEPLYLGLEIEVGGDTDYARRFLKLFNPDPDIILMRDGSVDGFEIVTNPMTYKYIQKNFYPKLEVGMRYLIDHGFKGHNAGGIHIHISEEAVTKYQVAQLSEILYGNKNDYETWLILTQRRRESTHWCKFEKSRQFYTITDDISDKPNISNERHTALNHDTRTHTYEFRIFNSSLRMDRIKKNIQCVIALLDYTSDHKYEERPVCHLTGFLEYVMKRKLFYPELAAFIEEKKLVEAHKNKDYSECNTNENERSTICA